MGASSPPRIRDSTEEPAPIGRSYGWPYASSSFQRW